MDSHARGVRRTRQGSTVNRRLAGGAARRGGERFEDDVRRAHRPAGVYLRRTSPAYRMVMVGGKLTPVVEADERGCPDFHGAYQGQAVAFECKSTTEDRWELKKLDPKQAAALDEATAAGCRTGVLLRYDRLAQVYWLPWPILRPYWIQQQRGEARRGDASMTPEDCGALGSRVVAYRWWEAAVKPLPTGVST